MKLLEPILSDTIHLQNTHARGISIIHIDRRSSEREHTIVVETKTDCYTMLNGTLTKHSLRNKAKTTTLVEPTSTDNITRELQAFLTETRRGSKTNTKRQDTDRSVCTVLDSLNRLK